MHVLSRDQGERLPSFPGQDRFCEPEAERDISHLRKVESIIRRANLSYPWMLEAFKTACSQPKDYDDSGQTC